MSNTTQSIHIPRALRSLFEPQLEQFGIEIHPNGEGWAGSGRSLWGCGSVWGTVVNEYCIVFSHEVFIEREMLLTEAPETAYACVCLVSEDSKATMPRMITAPQALVGGSLYSFVQPAGVFSGTLRQGGVYSSHCICFLPEYFQELDHRWPGTFTNMFERFGSEWSDTESRFIMSTLLGVGPQYHPASALLVQARVEQMVATLAASSNREKYTQRCIATHGQNGLVLEAQATIERMLDEGQAPTLDELANRLFVSRSHLCSAFSQETGKSIGYYVRMRRIERAKTMLASGDPIAQVAVRLGWSRCSTFSQAFKLATGVTPREWRSTNCK